MKKPYRSKLLVAEISDSKAITLLTRGYKAGQGEGLRVGKWLQSTGRKPNIEAMLTRSTQHGVLALYRTSAHA